MVAPLTGWRRCRPGTGSICLLLPRRPLLCCDVRCLVWNAGWQPDDLDDTLDLEEVHTNCGTGRRPPCLPAVCGRPVNRREDRFGSEPDAVSAVTDFGELRMTRARSPSSISACPIWFPQVTPCSGWSHHTSPTAHPTLGCRTTMGPASACLFHTGYQPDRVHLRHDPPDLRHQGHQRSPGFESGRPRDGLPADQQSPPSPDGGRSTPSTSSRWFPRAGATFRSETVSASNETTTKQQHEIGDQPPNVDARKAAAPENLIHNS